VIDYSYEGMPLGGANIILAQDQPPYDFESPNIETNVSDGAEKGSVIFINVAKTILIILGIFISIILMSNVFALYATNQVERVAELETISLIEPADDLTREFVLPTPLDVKKKYNITDIQLRQDIEMLTKKYNAQETNEQNRLSRIISVC
jgi:hypothetical protein